MADFTYIDLNTKKVSDDIAAFFPGWTGKDEKVCVFSPHDDDALIGAGFAMSAAMASGAEVFVFIFCRGNFGYKDASMKDTIENVRQTETSAAYNRMGVPDANIIRFGYSDNETIQNLGYTPDNKFKDMISALRKNKITRILLPNHYREHTDHLAVHLIGSFGAAQSGDLILVDLGDPQIIRSVAEYSVWADFSPEDALVVGRSASIRANMIIKASESVEQSIRDDISEYRSQTEIIRDLIEPRNTRKTSDGGFIELYRSFDPRPKLDYGPYIHLAEILS